ncbi:MAG: 6-bladed beta-propeller, partial [Ignavibacterium sp.]
MPFDMIRFRLVGRLSIFFIFYVLFILNQGCSVKESVKKRKTESDAEFIVSVDLKRVGEIDFKSMFSSVELIPLETKPESVLKTVTKLICRDGRYYILDRDQGAIFFFDRNGKFINKIQTLGIGPGEYTLIDDFVINRFTSNIELLDPRGEINVYDTEGRFIENFHLPLRAIHAFEYLTKDTLILYSIYESFKLNYFIKSKNLLIKQTYQVPDFITQQTPLLSVHTPFIIFNNQVRFYQGFTDTIYTLSPVKMEPYKVWDFNDNRLVITDLPDDREIDYYVNYLKSSNFAYAFYNYAENNDLIYTRLIFRKRWIFLVLNKQNNEYILISKFKEKINMPLSVVFCNNSLVTVINPSELQLLVNASVLDDEAFKTYKSISLYDNP